MKKLLTTVKYVCEWLDNLAIIYKSCIYAIGIIAPYILLAVDALKSNTSAQLLAVGWVSFVTCLIVFNNMAFYRGVFAVSAIILNDKHEVLLIYDDKKKIFKQPGGHYKTNKFVFRKELVTPYNLIMDTIEKETGLKRKDLDIIDFYGFSEETKINANCEDPCLLGEYGNNETSFAPIYVLKEISKERKSSGEKLHIDFFYAFKINTKIKNTPKMKFFNISDLRNQDVSTHKDLTKVCDDIVLQYKKMKYPTSNIRFCTFSDKQERKIYWRITKQCNAKCKYCISKSSGCSDSVNYDNNDIEEIINVLNKGQYQKLIITGGEPFLVKEFYKIILKVSEHTEYCDNISICTNALEWNDEFVDNLFSIEKIKKFVVSVDAYKENDFCSLKRIPNTHHYLSQVISFIHRAYENNKEVTINVMISDLFIRKAGEFVNFWRKNGFRDISLSYPVHSKQQNKHKILTIYNNMLSGKYGDMSFCKNIELILSECDTHNCPMISNIHSIDIRTHYTNCIDNIHK